MAKEIDISQHVRNCVPRATGPRRDDKIDPLRTAIWYAEVKARLNARTSYAIERLLEPRAFRKNAYGDWTHRNKWSKYETGLHVPCQALIASVERRVPGTKGLVNHVLWKALRHTPGARTDTGDLLKLLSPGIQEVVFPSRHNGPHVSHSEPHLTTKQLKMIERRAGLDALACLTIFLLAAPSDRKYVQAKALDIAISAYRILLILCVSMPIGQFSLKLLHVYKERIFLPARFDGLTFDLEDAEFLSSVNLLHVLLLGLEDGDAIGLDWDSSVHAMCKLLHGAYGLDIKFALDPLIRPDAPITEDNANEYREFERTKRFRSWGKAQVFSEIREQFPPRELW